MYRDFGKRRLRPATRDFGFQASLQQHELVAFMPCSSAETDAVTAIFALRALAAKKPRYMLGFEAPVSLHHT